MAEKIYEFGFGDQKLKLALPEEQVIQVIEGRAYPPVTILAVSAGSSC